MEPPNLQNLQMTQKITFCHFLLQSSQQEVVTLQHVKVAFVSNVVIETKVTFTCCSFASPVGLLTDQVTQEIDCSVE